MSNRLKGFRAQKRLINVGHGNYVLCDRVVAVLESGSLPVKRYRERALEENRLVDATAGRKTRSIVVIDSGHLILSALATQTLQERLATVGELSPADAEIQLGEFAI
jgi:hypothetical protein